jgi:hypothetical protein
MRMGERANAEDMRWIDEVGGEWRYHGVDQYHEIHHWDYNAWTEWNSPWQNVPLYPWH